MGKRAHWDTTVDEAGKRRLLAAYESGAKVAVIAKRFDRSPAWVKKQITMLLAASSSNHAQLPV